MAIELLPVKLSAALFQLLPSTMISDTTKQISQMNCDQAGRGTVSGLNLRWSTRFDLISLTLLTAQLLNWLLE